MTDPGKVFGQALYDLAREEGLERRILEELDALDRIFRAEAKFLQLLSAPGISKQERLMLLDGSLRGMVHPYVLNFLKILTEKGVICHFSGCCQTFLQQYNRDRGILPVAAYTAVPMPDALRRALREKLSQVTGKSIELSCRVDPQCLGGVRLDWDGGQLDGTLRRRLEDIRSILKNTAF